MKRDLNLAAVVCALYLFAFKINSSFRSIEKLRSLFEMTSLYGRRANCKETTLRDVVLTHLTWVT